MNDDLTVICTNQKNHGPVRLGTIYRDEDGVRTSSARRGRSQHRGAEWQIQGESEIAIDPGWMIMSATDYREDFDGHERWRFTCKKCTSLDLVLNADSLTKLVDGWLQDGRRVIDLSYVRR